MKRVGLVFLDRPDLAEQIRLAQYAERRGFESVWVCETRLVRDAVTPLAAFASATQRIKLATGVVNNWTRTAALMAMTLATLHELSQGRVILGIGAYWDPLAWKQGSRDRDELVVADLALDEINSTRATWQFFRDRRPDTYGGLVAP